MTASSPQPSPPKEEREIGSSAGGSVKMRPFTLFHAAQAWAARAALEETYCLSNSRSVTEFAARVASSAKSLPLRSPERVTVSSALVWSFQALLWVASTTDSCQRPPSGRRGAG